MHHAKMSDNVFVSRIPDGGPEFHRCRSIDFNQGRHASDTPFRENLLDLTDEAPGNALATATRMHHEAIHVAAPAVARRNVIVSTVQRIVGVRKGDGFSARLRASHPRAWYSCVSLGHASRQPQRQPVKDDRECWERR